MLKNKYQKISTLTFSIFCAVFLFQINDAQALTPIARVDVVPYQRIEHNTAFNFGVVAFSKEGIDRVEFTISGQGYSGGTKTATTMTHNPETDVWEYWVPIASHEFTSDGPITITAIAYGEDLGFRDLGEVPLVVDATGELAQPKAWISMTGNNSTAEVDNRSQPFATVTGAINAIQAVNGGKSDGAIIYFFEGTYSLGNGANPSTTNEWLTLENDATAVKENVIIHNGGAVAATNLIKVSGLTLTSGGQYDYVFNSNPESLWIHNSRLIGAGRHISGSSPVGSLANSYFTDTYIYDVDFALREGSLARGLDIHHIGNDAFQNFPFVVNVRVDNQDPGTTNWHADGYQSWGAGPQNRIVYNFFGTDMHYQGLFMRAETSAGQNNAFVNIFMEMREPGRSGTPGNPEAIVLSSGTISGPWDHLLMWHCTFPVEGFGINGDETSGSGYTNSSFIGNFFYELSDSETALGAEPTYSLPGNAQNNDWLYNHYVRSYTDVSGCAGNPQPDGCPTWYSISPDSSSQGSQSVGGMYGESVDYLNLADQATYANFGVPLDGSILVNRIPFATVPADVHGNLRVGYADVGAVEHISGGDTTPPSAPTGLGVL